MLGEILTQITQLNQQKHTLISTLTAQNEDIHNQLREIQESLNELPMQQIADYVKKRSSAAVNANKSEKVEHLFALTEEFYEDYARDEAENKRCEYLLEEIKLIIELAQQHDLDGALSLHSSSSSQANLTRLKELIELISQQILEYQNQQNINKFETEQEEVCQSYLHVIDFYRKFKEVMTSIYKRIVKSNYQVSQTSFSIRLEHFQAIWTEDPSFYQEFLANLNSFLERFISYDINDRQYAVTTYSLTKSAEELSLSVASKVIFDSNQVSLHYETLISNLQTFHRFFIQLSSITPQQHQLLTSSTKKSILSTIKSYIEYLLPYLTMQMRRKLLSFLSIRTEQSLDIYQLLVSLRMCGKDADLLVKTIKLIISKVQEEPSSLGIVIKFIEIAKENKKNHQMSFFICNQIVEQLEEGEVTAQTAQAIKKLLLTRQQMRMKIHNCEQSQFR